MKIYLSWRDKLITSFAKKIFAKDVLHSKADQFDKIRDIVTKALVKIRGAWESDLYYEQIRLIETCSYSAAAAEIFKVLEDYDEEIFNLSDFPREDLYMRKLAKEYADNNGVATKAYVDQVQEQHMLDLTDGIQSTGITGEASKEENDETT